ncbi:MAG TPA: serine/threonine-protein kinase [Gemmatales bacterium]|nr:serine/threonine-protein kinase [Gemmatales bacterium]
MSERDIFIAAFQIESQSALEEYLSKACGDDVALRQRVEKLLRWHHESHNSPNETSYKETGVFTPVDSQDEASTKVVSPDLLLGTVLNGKYKILEQIGLGGMGAVYLAEQSLPIRRKVAIKIIKPGMDSSQVLSRFEAERHALALMDHPGIARVLDGGMTDEKRPYFVMEYVKGEPLTDFCDNQQLNVKERLNLFTQICHAVQHAHQKGVIHRDLKPSNILVCLYDGTAVPKVIDFGLAKALYQPLTDLTLHTGHGMVLGTPLYMSPEQAEVNNYDVDTRTDIYALGVILYELLTGTTPLEKNRFKKAAWDEVLRIIREEEPLKPSTKISRSEKLVKLSTQRKLEPRKLTQLISGDLDWIVMKALAKERNRRYETANSFAMDIQRYLADEPVLAGPPTFGYQASKFIKRNRGKVLAASLVLLALLTGIAGTTFGLIRAEQQRHIAEQAAEAERTAKLDAVVKQTEAETQQRRAESSEKLAGERLNQVEAEKKKAEEEKRIAVAVKDFLQLKLLGQADVTEQANSLINAGGMAEEAKKDPTIRELLNRAAVELAPQKIETNFPNQPLLQAEILLTVGNTFRGIGAYDRSISFLQRSVALYKKQLGLEHPETLGSMYCLAVAYQSAGKVELALPLHEQTLKLKEAMHGFEHPETLISMGNLAIAYTQAGKPNLALPLFEQTLKLTKELLGPDHPQTLVSMHNLAWVNLAAHKLDVALPLFEEALRLFKAILGVDHPHTLICSHNLASAYMDANKLDLALPLLEETLKSKKAKFGPEHPETLATMGSLAMAYQAAGKMDQAMPLFEETLRLFKTTLGPEAPNTLKSMNNLALAYMAVGKLEMAVPLFEVTLKLRKAKLGLDHNDTLITMSNLARTYLAAGKKNLALPLLQETLKLQQTKLGPEHPETLSSIASIGLLLLEKNDYAGAEEMLRQCLTHRSKIQPDAWTTFNTKSMLGGALMGQKKNEEAEPLLLSGYQGMKQRESTIPPHGILRITEALDRLIQLYIETNKPGEVKKWQAEKARIPKLLEKK